MSRVNIMDLTPHHLGSVSQCSNCQQTFPTDKLNDIADIEDRIEAGGIVPSGECPVCFALCYLTRSVFPSDVEKVLESLLKWARNMGEWESPVWEEARKLHGRITGKRMED